MIQSKEFGGVDIKRNCVRCLRPGSLFSAVDVTQCETRAYTHRTGHASIAHPLSYTSREGSIHRARRAVHVTVRHRVHEEGKRKKRSAEEIGFFFRFHTFSTPNNEPGIELSRDEQDGLVPHALRVHRVHVVAHRGLVRPAPLLLGTPHPRHRMVRVGGGPRLPHTLARSPFQKKKNKNQKNQQRGTPLHCGIEKRKTTSLHPSLSHTHTHVPFLSTLFFCPRRIVHYRVTSGGMFGFGLFRDMFRIPDYVRQANGKPEHEDFQKEYMKVTGKEGSGCFLPLILSQPTMTFSTLDTLARSLELHIHDDHVHFNQER